MLKNTVAIIAALLLPIVAGAQSMAYVDADTPSEAVGMMKSTITIAAAMVKACSARYPELSQEMDANLGRWKSADAMFIGKAEYHWAAMLKKQPQMAEQTAYIESVALKNLEMVAAAPGDAGPQVGAYYCKQHFANLASGVWRSRTPRAYAYLEKAP